MKSGIIHFHFKKNLVPHQRKLQKKVINKKKSLSNYDFDKAIPDLLTSFEKKLLCSCKKNYIHGKYVCTLYLTSLTYRSRVFSLTTLRLCKDLSTVF